MVPAVKHVNMSTVKPLSPQAKAATALSATSIRALRQSKLAAGHTYSVLDAKGRVRHVHPDGTTRTSRDPTWASSTSSSLPPI